MSGREAARTSASNFRRHCSCRRTARRPSERPRSSPKAFPSRRDRSRLLGHRARSPCLRRPRRSKRRASARWPTIPPLPAGQRAQRAFRSRHPDRAIDRAIGPAVPTSPYRRAARRAVRRRRAAKTAGRLRPARRKHWPKAAMLSIRQPIRWGSWSSRLYRRRMHRRRQPPRLRTARDRSLGP